MALTVQALTDARDALVLALARGVLSVRDASGEEVTYATPAAMRSALAHIESRITAMQATAPNVIKFNTSKGV